MFTGLYKEGDKVIPIAKTAGSRGGLWRSSVWQEAHLKNQPFIYVTDIENNIYICHFEEDIRSGDFFNENDLIPYIVSNRAGISLLKGD